MHNNTNKFTQASKMPYAENEQTRNKAYKLYNQLEEYLKLVKKDNSLFFTPGETVYIPDVHGDFVHLILTLHRHGLLDNKLNLNNDFKYIFLGDFYDRAPDSDVIDLWLNKQIDTKIQIYRLIGNHEMAFFEREKNGHPIIFPSQDSIKDISNNFQITENLLKNIASGNIIAAYAEDSRDVINHISTMLYIHSYVTNDDFKELGLDINSDIFNFAHKLNGRLKMHGQYAYNLFGECKKTGEYNWNAIVKPFYNDPLFNISKTKNDINTSFVWRRTGLPTLKIYPLELDLDIPDNVYQIVGHTPVFSFNLPKHQPINIPFTIKAKKGSGKVQFSDVGIGYYYKNDFERPEVVINRNLAILT